ncbi:hypothetical protein RND71_034872 [Anisodus tanguticus]|uniref:DUF4283 domain-containing protein n=1 Tax=Anisodus tanguticus TaxID=243964 RepID=A0AAE1UZ88_9SOLA|nr:hypothetical protein RND71_034872 [Anisodus tanguticus]
MASSSNTNDDYTVPLEEMYANLNLNGADGCLEHHEPPNPNSANGYASGFPWCIVCRILTEKPMTMRFFQDAMAQTWMPGECTTMKDLNNNCFLIQFYHERDFTRVMSDGPWNYDQSMILMQPLEPNQNTRQVQLTTMELWVQIHNIVSLFTLRTCGEGYWKFLGEFVRDDSKNYNLIWRDYMHVRVRMDVRKLIDVEVHLLGIPVFRFMGFYGYPGLHERRASWNLIKSLKDRSQLPWCIVGDFNDILEYGDKMAHIQQPKWRINEFREAVNFCNLFYLGYVGNRFTWERSRNTHNWVRERLDSNRNYTFELTSPISQATHIALDIIYSFYITVEFLQLEPKSKYTKLTSGFIRGGLGAYGEKNPWIKFSDHWTRITEPVGGRLSYKPPIYDINAPDLYIPFMAFGTYVVLAGLSLGLQGRIVHSSFGNNYMELFILLFDAVDMLVHGSILGEDD